MYRRVWKSHLSNGISVNKSSREIAFRKISINRGENVKLSIRLEILENLLIVSDSFHFSNVYGGLSFSNISNSTLLRSILLRIPYEYYLIFKGGGGSSELYFLIISAKFSFYDRDSVISKVLELVNSLSISIPAEDVKIMSGNEILSEIFNNRSRGVKIV